MKMSDRRKDLRPREKLQVRGAASLSAGLLIESLYRRITTLTVAKIIRLSAWAKANEVSPHSASNKARRGTIPAFRRRGVWMIAEDYHIKGGN